MVSSRLRSMFVFERLRGTMGTLRMLGEELAIDSQANILCMCVANRSKIDDI